MCKIRNAAYGMLQSLVTMCVYCVAKLQLSFWLLVSFVNGNDAFAQETRAVPSLPALGPWSPPPNRTGPLARKYLPGFPYSWSLRRLRQKISSIYCTVICYYPSAAQEQPFTASLLYITKTVKLTRYALLVFVRSCSSINNKIISLKKLFHHSQLGALKKKKNPGALGTCPVCPLIKTALNQSVYVVRNYRFWFCDSRLGGVNYIKWAKETITPPNSWP